MSEWIKCSERMPERGVPVLIWLLWHHRAEVSALGNGQHWDGGEMLWERASVSHWMLLPEPPRD